MHPHNDKCFCSLSLELRPIGTEQGPVRTLRAWMHLVVSNQPPSVTSLPDPCKQKLDISHRYDSIVQLPS